MRETKTNTFSKYSNLPKKELMKLCDERGIPYIGSPERYLFICALRDWDEEQSTSYTEYTISIAVMYNNSTWEEKQVKVEYGKYTEDLDRDVWESMLERVGIDEVEQVLLREGKIRDVAHFKVLDWEGVK